MVVVAAVEDTRAAEAPNPVADVEEDIRVAAAPSLVADVEEAIHAAAAPSLVEAVEVVIEAAEVVAVTEVVIVDPLVEGGPSPAFRSRWCSSEFSLLPVARRFGLLRWTGSCSPPGEPLEPPSAEVRNAEDRLVAGPSTQASKTKDSSALSLAGLSLSETPKLPRRPGYGTIGRPIVLRANYFQVIPKPDLQIFRYHVDIIPGTKVTRKKRRIFDLLVETVPALASARPAIATDRSAIIVTLKKLALGSTDSVEGQLMYYEAEEVGPKQEKPIVYEYKIQYTNTLSVQELLNYLSSTNRATHYDGKEAVIQALNIAMMRKPMADPTVSGSVRLNRFFPTGSVIGQLGGGLVALQGYYTSVRTSTLRLLLNVNSITATFYRPIVVSDLIKEFKSANRDGGFRLTAFLKGLRVEIKHLKTKKGMFRTRVIAGIARDPVLGASAKQVKFTWTEKNETVSVERYFLKRMPQISLPLYPSLSPSLSLPSLSPLSPLSLSSLQPSSTPFQHSLPSFSGIRSSRMQTQRSCR